jgi:UDP-glucose 4-epimerase
MRVMVTGGAGYIGSIVTEILLGDGHDVLVLDNLSKGHRDAVAAGASFVGADILDRELVTASLRDFACEAVIHMAAASLVGESVTNPAHYYRQNVVAGLSLLQAMRDAGVMRLVFSSTAAVYGEPQKQPIEETDPTVRTNPYGETKLAFERVLRWYSTAYGLDSISLRYFNAEGATAAHGERHHPETHLVPLVLQAAAGRELTLFGTDYPTPDGTCVRGLHSRRGSGAHALALAELDRCTGYRAYNLGCGGAAYSVREVIDTAALVTGRRISVRVADRRPGDPAVLVASADRIRRELGWRPHQQDLDAIIGTAWSWIQRHGSAVVP